jgi:hypothetical protein
MEEYLASKMLIVLVCVIRPPPPPPPPGALFFVCCDLQIVIKFKFLRSGYEICSVQLSEVTRTEGVLAALLYKILILNQMLTVARKISDHYKYHTWIYDCHRLCSK